MPCLYKVIEMATYRFMEFMDQWIVPKFQRGSDP